MAEKKDKPPKPKKVRADKYEEKLKIDGTFEQAVKILVRDKPNIQPQK